MSQSLPPPLAIPTCFVRPSRLIELHSVMLAGLDLLNGPQLLCHHPPHTDVAKAFKRLSNVFVPKADSTNEVSFIMEQNDNLIFLFLPRQTFHALYKRAKMNFACCFVFVVPPGLQPEKFKLPRLECELASFRPALVALSQKIVRAEEKYCFLSEAFPALVERASEEMSGLGIRVAQRGTRDGTLFAFATTNAFDTFSESFDAPSRDVLCPAPAIDGDSGLSADSPSSVAAFQDLFVRVFECLSGGSPSLQFAGGNTMYLSASPQCQEKLELAIRREVTLDQVPVQLRRIELTSLDTTDLILLDVLLCIDGNLSGFEIASSLNIEQSVVQEALAHWILCGIVSTIPDLRRAKDHSSLCSFQTTSRFLAARKDPFDHPDVLSLRHFIETVANSKEFEADHAVQFIIGPFMNRLTTAERCGLITLKSWLDHRIHVAQQLHADANVSLHQRSRTLCEMLKVVQHALEDVVNFCLGIRWLQLVE